MTTLISWVSYDTKFAAAYMASDSRITWNSSGERRWDAGRKLFPSRMHPDLFGYAGDVVFPAVALSQIVEAMDEGMITGPEPAVWERHEAVKKCLRDSFQKRHQAEDQSFSILHVGRSGRGKESTVHAWCIDYDVNSEVWTDRILHVPVETGVVERLGTGAGIAKLHQDRWNRIKPFSREIFSSFCDAICSGTDPLSGGAPQLSGFYSSGPAKTFGVLSKGIAFYNGLPLSARQERTEREWRDELFQRIDISTRRLVEGGQVHMRPKDV